MLRVCVVEMPASWGEPEEALAEVERVLADGPETDLVLLPEASLTGYVSPELDFDLTRFAEPLEGPTYRALSKLAVEHRAHLVAPLVLAEGGACFNAMFGVDPSGALSFVYRKRHPWMPETWATAGDNPYPRVSIGGLEVTLALCFDVHFVDAEASETLSACDLLLFPSAWVEEGSDSRLPRLVSIARRHGISVAAANWAPGVVTVPGQGHSVILDTRGAELARVRAGERRADAALRGGGE